MAMIPHSTWFLSPNNPISVSSTSKTLSFSLNTPHFKPHRPFKISASSTNPSEPAKEDVDSQPDVPASVKLAFERAREYKKKKGLQGDQKITSEDSGGKSISDLNSSQNLISNSIGDVKENGTVGSSYSNGGVPVAEKLDLEEEKKNNGATGGSDIEGIERNSDSSAKDRLVPQNVDYVNGNKDVSSDADEDEIPPSVKIAFEKVREYKKNKGDKLGVSGSENMEVENLRDRIVQISNNKKKESAFSSIDFLGFDFSDKKKNRDVPAGLVPPMDPFPEDLPEVEFILGDASKFEVPSASKLNPSEDDGDSGVYKPKVSTWGVFPRPSNISKTFGGGRTIRPGEVLETAEDRAAKEARTRQLIASYKKKMGITIDRKTRYECEEALKDGDYLMDLGKLEEALPFYEKVMKTVVFQSDLHGLAALQWSICQDSLRRTSEARVMYEKLQSHPVPQVRNKARQFIFSFQAMAMLKVSSLSAQRTTGYENYFEAFLEDKANYSATDDEQTEILQQVLPYIIFLLSPLLIVLIFAIRKGF
ncbi:hypothetical protein QJS10_CPB17g01777 [Acorus calamus]|uniref:Uncharacterized protein n=1 Tax=Acorus calamus TaxID=4465 RepID=A0AAV9CX38_ACOCL|nr:hypothetical protein QJS10_CPB17g01777 [Acorus calamus]